MEKKSAPSGAEAPADQTSQAQEPIVKTVEEDVTVVEATPVVLAETDQPGVENPQPTENTVLIKPPKKKISLAAIIGFVVFGLILVAGIGFAVWYFAVYQNPQNIAFDAMNKFLSAEHVQSKGQVQFLSKGDQPMHFKFELENESKSLPSAASAKLTISRVEQKGTDYTVVSDDSISLDLGSVVMPDGVIYFQVSNLTEMVETLIPDQSVFASEVGQAISNIIELVDGEWWRISVPEIVEELELGSDGKPIEELYSCVISAAQKDNSDQIAGFYREHQFINIEKSKDTSPTNGTSDYLATLNYDNLAGFLNELPHSTTSTEILACYNTYAEQTDGDQISPEDAETVSPDDLRKTIPENTYIRLNISDFEHELKAITVGLTDDDADLTGGFSFSYEPASISAPENYRSVTELVDEAVTIISELFYVAPDFGCDSDNPDYCFNQPSGNFDSAFDSFGV